jgi:hypothetical protein
LRLTTKLHHRVHVAHAGFVEIDLRRNVHRLAIDDETAAALLAQLGEDEVELFAVNLEDGRAQLDLRPFGQREDGLEDLTR